MNPLEQTDIITLSASSPKLIENALSSLKSSQFANGRWVDPANCYTNDAANEFKRLHGNPSGGYTDTHLADAVASSMVIHLYDGWAYFSEAIKSLSSGDTSISKHLTYYAELRAALGLLASQGVGVFNTKHAIANPVDFSTIPSRRGSPTHEFAWLALENWSNSPASTALIGKNIRFAGLSLAEWVQEFSVEIIYGTSLRAISQSWVKQWGIDLSNFEGDKNARNEVSYRTSFDFNSQKTNPQKTHEAIKEFWSVTDPTNKTFEKIDRYLIGSTLEGIYKKDRQAYIEENKKELYPTFEHMIYNVCQRRGVSHKLAREAICRTSSTNVIFDATKKSGINDPRQSVEMLSRAYLLLRLASLTINEALNNAGIISERDLEFWWKSVGEKNGMWPENNAPFDLRDLWDETNYSVELIDDSILSKGDMCWYLFNATNAPNFSVVTKFEKVALWALCC